MGRYAIFNGLVYGGGTAVIPNPEGTPTDELHSLQIGDDIYEIVGGGGSGGNASLDATTLYDTPITSTGTYTLADDYNNYDFIGFKAGNGSTETDIRLYAVKDIQDSMNDNLVITNNVTNSWFNFTINENELTIPGKTVSTIYSVIGYKIKGGSSGASAIEKTQSEYNALPQSEKENGTIYFVHKDAGETTISGTFTTGSTQYEKVIVDCGFKPTLISVILPFSNGDTYAEYDETISTTTSTWEIPMESRTYTITLGSETGESGITDILDNGFKFRCNASNTRNVNCTFEATGILDNEVNKIYYMGTEYANTNGGSGGGSQELISYDTTITTTQYGWWTAEDKDGNTLDPDQYELIAVTPFVNNSPSWVGSWDGAFFINTVDGVTHRYDVTFVNINDGGYIRTSRTWDVKVVYRDKNAAGGGGGSTVVPNPQEEPTDTLNTVEIDGVVYNIEGGSEGEGVEIYSEDEYIVGKWIDGKKLYQKTYHLAQAITVAGGGTWTDTGIDISDISILVDSKFSQDIAVWDAINGINDNGTLKATILASGSLTVDTITLRYTKTVETPAPAWGGSVNNYYANFIDTDNVIQAFTQISDTSEHTYTATEDCIITYYVASQGDTYIKINNVLVGGNYSQAVSALCSFIAVKKGQTFSFQQSYAGSSSSGYTVYGISYGSGGSSSGGGTSEGEGVEIYSEDEYIVGKWVDGKKLYQKTFYYTHNDTIGDGYTTIASLSDADYFEFVECSLYNPNDKRSYALSYAYGSKTTALTYDNGDIKLRVNSDTWNANWDVVITVRYTKTVETPAPAWGGSVTNNYANFIDTSNVIDSGVYNPTTPLSYTAAEDCFMVIVLIANNNPCIVSVDNKEIYRLYDNGVSSITAPVPIKKGQTITATTSYSAEDSPYTVYGISYGSGGSSSGSSVEYSTEEKEVGTWIDGSKVYKKTVTLGSMPAQGNTKSVNHSIENLGLVIEASIIVKNTSNIQYPVPMVSRLSTGDQTTYYISQTAVTVVNGNNSSINETASGYAVLTYTKAVS